MTRNLCKQSIAVRELDNIVSLICFALLLFSSAESLPRPFLLEKFTLCAVFISTFIFAWFDTNAECLSNAKKPLDVMKHPVEFASYFLVPLQWIFLCSRGGKVFEMEMQQH